MNCIPQPSAPILQVFNNGVLISSGQALSITGDPTTGAPIMPGTLSARLLWPYALTQFVSWSMTISYVDTYHDPTGLYTNYSRTYSPGLLPASSAWNITNNMGGAVIGGTAIVSYKYGTYAGSLQFSINGNNAYPTTPQAQAYITANQSPSWGQSWSTANPSQSWGQLWFLTFIGSEETFMPSCSLPNSYHQFDNNFLPCWGTPYGYGLMQIEKPNTITQPPYASLIPPESILWNWQANVQASLLEFQYKNGTKDPQGAYNYWTHPAGTFGNGDIGGQLDQYLQWNKSHSVGVPSVTCSQNNTCAYANPGPVDCPFGMNSDGSVPSGQRSYADAVWIKMYNGAPSGNYIFWNNTGSRATNPIWDYNPSEQPAGVKQPIYYVANICNQ